VAHPGQAGKDLAQDLDVLARQLVVQLCEAGDVQAGLRQAAREACLDRVEPTYRNNGDGIRLRADHLRDRLPGEEHVGLACKRPVDDGG
jgi:hypothetical protein